MAADHDPELLIRAATTLAGPSAESFTHIYEESFPPSEREDVGGLLDSIASGERLCYLAISADRLVGLAVLLRCGPHPSPSSSILRWTQRFAGRGSAAACWIT